jgi:choline dehydrogenase-like flavoprotein
MPFIDLNTKASGSFNIPSSDIIIIGAGAAGILLAIKLSRQGKSILLIESGHFGEDEEKQKLNEVAQKGKKLENAVWGRKRAIGGTTIAWGGQSLPFTSIDFEKRDWVQNSGWPISYDELEPYYKEANSFMGIDTMNYNTDIFPKVSVKNPGLDPEVFNFHVSKWATQPNFYLLYKNELQKKITIIYNAQLTAIQKNNVDKVEIIKISNFKDAIFLLPVNLLIIAAGAIETVKILLNNNIGNHSGWLGKCFMDHPCIEVGIVNTNNPYRLQRFFNTHIWNGHKYSIRLSLNNNYQQKNKLLNCSAAIMFLLPQESFDPYAELKSFKKDFKLIRLIKVSGSAFSIIKSTWAYIANKFYYKTHAVASVSLMIEQEPMEESTISLDNEKDAFDNFKALLNWQISFATWRTAVATANAVKKEIEKLKLGNVNLYENINLITPNGNDYLTDVCHHMGGCRMSSSEDRGVVNTDLQVWGTKNLYVCSTAVFPTVSHSNPTLTMLALGARLTKHLA